MDWLFDNASLLILFAFLLGVPQMLRAPSGQTRRRPLMNHAAPAVRSDQQKALDAFLAGRIETHEYDAILSEIEGLGKCPWPEVHEKVFGKPEAPDTRCYVCKREEAVYGDGMCIPCSDKAMARKKREQQEEERSRRRAYERDLDQRAINLAMSEFDIVPNYEHLRWRAIEIRNMLKEQDRVTQEYFEIDQCHKAIAACYTAPPFMIDEFREDDGLPRLPGEESYENAKAEAYRRLAAGAESPYKEATRDMARSFDPKPW